MILFPNAKINLGLHILSKRKDNFHEIETLMCPVGLCDILEFLPLKGNDTSLKLTGIPVEGNMEENLVYKAYRILQEHYQLPELAIHLHKIIPAGAGLGGGSSDAAFMLKGLNEFFSLGISKPELGKYASSLGSDCSFFIDNLPSLATGRGEILKPVKDYLKDYKLYLFFPEFTVSTAEAYQDAVPENNRDGLESILERGVTGWKSNLLNDFEKTVLKKYPVLAELKDQLYNSGAVYASLSGSGSAVFGLFERESPLPGSLKKFLIYKS